MLSRILLAALVSLLPTVPVLAEGLSLIRVASGLQGPVYAAAPPGDTGRLFVLERAGRIRIVDLATRTVLPTLFLDISSEINQSPPANDEAGLLSLVFASDYATSGKFYVYYIANVAPVLEARVSRFTAQGPPATSFVANPAETVIFRLEKTSAHHNGGTVAIRGDFLYLAEGDGAFDSTRVQDDASLFGKILRFDLTNPTPTPKVWAKGFRNPYRFSFDRETGDLYVGDVGETSREEIDVEPAASAGGRNYGWPIEEGSMCFEASNALCGDASLVRPVYEYPHTEGCAVIGGQVYRGAAIPQLVGRYVFADLCSSRTWSLVWDGAGGIVSPLIEHTADLEADFGELVAPVAIVEGGASELYFVDITGDVFHLVPEPGSALLAAAAVASLATCRRYMGAGATRLTSG